MNRTKTMFDVSRPRAKSRVLMHVIDAGAYLDDKDNVKFACKCGYESEWMVMRFAEAKRGVPCPKCNAEEP